MTDLPDLTIVLGPQTRVSLALNALIRENRQFLAARGMTVLPSRLASPIVRRAIDERSERERLEEFRAKTRPAPALLSAINMFGPPQAGMMKRELFPDAEITLAGLSPIAKNARIVLAIDPLPDFFLAAESASLEERIRLTPWEVLYELSWFELVQEVVEVLPDCAFLVLTGVGAARNPAGLAKLLLGGAADEMPNPHVLIRQLISETGHAVLDRMLERGAPDEATLSDLQKSFANAPTKDDLKERLGLDRVTGILLQQRFEEDLARIAAIPNVEVV